MRKGRRKRGTGEGLGEERDDERMNRGKREGKKGIGGKAVEGRGDKKVMI